MKAIMRSQTTGKTFALRALGICESKICSCIERNKRNAEKKGELTIQCDELWFRAIAQRGNDQANKQWLWLVLDAKTREIVGASVGDRDKVAERKLWSSLPAVYRRCAVAYTALGSLRNGDV